MPSPGLCSLRSEGKNPRSASRSRPAGREIPRSAALSVGHFFPKMFKVQKVITPENLRSASRSRPAGRELPRSAALSVGHFFPKIFKVQKVITAENLRSASPSRPAGREIPRSAALSVGGHFFSKKCSKSKKKKKKSYLHITTVRKLSSRPTFLSHRQDEVRVRPRPGFFFSFFSIVQFLRAKRAPVSPRRSVKISARSVHALWLKVEKTASRHLFLPFFVFLGLFRMRKRLSRHPLAISDREEPRSLRYRPASRLDLSTPKKKSPRPDWP